MARTCCAGRWAREARGNGQAARRFHRGLQEQWHRCRPRGQHLRPGGKVRRLRLQQVALGSLRPGLLPDRLAEDPLPAPFMAAVLTADMQNTDKVVTLIEECRHMKLRIVAPDVNNSEFRFTVDDDGRIVYGTRRDQGRRRGGRWRRSPNAAPKAGPFNTLFDFCDRVDLKRINKRTLEALIRAGALDRLGPHYHDELKAYQATVDLNRAVLLAAMEEAIQAAEQAARSHDSGHMDLFGGVFAEPEADV
ncbi:hypothetical protein ACPA9J_33030 [Pseudomonas aeruginosa]